VPNFAFRLWWLAVIEDRAIVRSTGVIRHSERFISTPPVLVLFRRYAPNFCFVTHVPRASRKCFIYRVVINPRPEAKGDTLELFHKFTERAFRLSDLKFLLWVRVSALLFEWSGWPNDSSVLACHKEPPVGRCRVVVVLETWIVWVHFTLLENFA